MFGYLQALTSPITQVTIATMLTISWGRFLTKIVHAKNAIVPNVNATML
jgi:hypothetical protein